MRLLICSLWNVLKFGPRPERCPTTLRATTSKVPDQRVSVTSRSQNSIWLMLTSQDQAPDNSTLAWTRPSTTWLMTTYQALSQRWIPLSLPDSPLIPSTQSTNCKVSHMCLLLPPSSLEIRSIVMISKAPSPEWREKSQPEICWVSTTLQVLARRLPNQADEPTITSTTMMWLNKGGNPRECVTPWILSTLTSMGSKAMPYRPGMFHTNQQTPLMASSKDLCQQVYLPKEPQARDVLTQEIYWEPRQTPNARELSLGWSADRSETSTKPTT